MNTATAAVCAACDGVSPQGKRPAPTVYSGGGVVDLAASDDEDGGGGARQPQNCCTRARETKKARQHAQGGVGVPSPDKQQSTLLSHFFGVGATAGGDGGDGGRGGGGGGSGGGCGGGRQGDGRCSELTEEVSVSDAAPQDEIQVIVDWVPPVTLSGSDSDSDDGELLLRVGARHDFEC